MIGTIEELELFFLEHDLPVYSRENFDNFVDKKHIDLNVPSIHITGTNGKGSTANFIYNIYRSAGYRVGMYLSPYFGSCLKSIYLAGENIKIEDYLRIFNFYYDDFIKFNLTSFEMQTIVAYSFFNEQKVDLAIIEVGMGGDIDATNIITPLLSIITSVSLEHTSYLGRSVSEIAHTKAGIIKERRPCLVGKLDESALFAVKEVANYFDAKVYIVDDFHHEQIDGETIKFDYYPYHDLKIRTHSFYQLKNASIAVEAIKILMDKFVVEEKAIKAGLSEPLLEYRYEFLNSNTIIDGAHNPEAVSNLVETLEKDIKRPIHVLFASFLDKNIDLILPMLQKASSSVTITTFPHKRSRTKEEYFLYLDDYQFVDDYLKAYLSLTEQYPDDVILITGSLYFVSLFKEEFKKI